MLLQKSDGTFELVVWGERLKGADEVTVRLGAHVSGGEGLRSDDRDAAHRKPRQGQGLQLTLMDHPLIIAIAQK